MYAKHAKGYMTNLEYRAFGNTKYCEVAFTGKYVQLVLMSLAPREETGEDVHPHNEQVVRIKSGEGKVIVNDTAFPVNGESAVLVPEGARFNIINLSHTDTMQLYISHAPPFYEDGTVFDTKLDAMNTATASRTGKPAKPLSRS